MGNAGCLLSRVIHVKRSLDREYAIIDAGMNDLIRPALYGAKHPTISLKDDSAPGQNHAYTFAGPVCETGDIFLKDHVSGELAEGDLVAILVVGAYGMSMASEYNARPLAAEVMIREGTAEPLLIRRRRTVEQSLEDEMCCDEISY